MLQSLNLDVSAPSVKLRGGSSNDPAEGVFAGLMAQASIASSPPAPASVPKADPVQDRSSSARIETQAPSRPSTESASSETQSPSKPASVTASDSDDSRDSAKAAVQSSETKDSQASDAAKTDSKATTEAGKDSKAADGTKTTTENSDPAQAAALKQALLEQATADLKTQPAQTAPAAMSSTGISIGATATQTQSASATATVPQPTVTVAAANAKVGATTADAAEQPTVPLPKDVQVKVTFEAQGAGAAAKPALTELLYAPKAEIQAPKWAVDPTKTSAEDGKKAIAAGAEKTAGMAKPGDIPGPVQASSSETEQQSMSGKTAQMDDPSKLGLTKTDVQTHANSSVKTTTPVAEMPMVAPGEGVKASATTVRADAPAMARSGPILTQVEGSIRWMIQNKVQGAELQLHPESLGRVVIQLKVEGQNVHARLWASESTSLTALQDHKSFLESSLKEQGLNLSSFDLHSGARGNGAQTMPQEQAPMAMSREFAPLEVKQEMPTEIIADSADPHQIEVYA
jgi:flagellar hook-length control protein FliK